MRLLPKQLTPLSGILLAATVFTGPAFAQTGLTTIQDTLFKADGTRFSGTLTIQWSTFDATNIGTIVQQSKSVDVLNGNLQVQLVPNAGAQAPANIYTVHYQSDGNQQFIETWSVPASATPVTVAAVRTGTLVSAVGGTAAGNSTPIVESAVINLVSDLAQRPVKGPGFGTGSVAVINQSGQIETAVGDVGECVYVDGTAGPCGSQGSQFFDAEIPGGIVDGTNNTFTLANPPSGTSLALFRNGLYMLNNFDYTLSGQTITFVAGGVPQPADTLVASYRIDPGSTSDVVSSNVSSRLVKSATSAVRTVTAQVLCSSGGRSNSTAAFMSLGGCDVPAASLKAGDRIEVRFNFAHTGTASAYDLTVNWGSTTVLARHGSKQDSAVAGQAEAAIGGTGAQISVQSWGTALGFLPGISSSPVQAGLRVDFQGRLSTAGSDTVGLTNFTVLRYPGN
jgi:hypothetical protein